MGTCVICGQRTGLFSGAHVKCQAARASALASIRRAARDAFIAEKVVLSRLSLETAQAKTQQALGDKADPRYDEAVRLVVEEKMASVPLLQQRMGIGFSRASVLIDMMARDGLLGPPRGSAPREILKKVSPERVEGFWDRSAGLMKQGYLTRELCHDAVIDGWLDAAELFLANEELLGVEASVLDAVKAGDKEFELTDREERLIEARQLLRLSRVKSQIGSQESVERVPFDVIPAQGEGIFWTLSPSTYSRQVSISTHGGGFGGVSVRVAPGLYVRSGGYRGESRPTHRLEPVATGTVGMSNLQTWFKSGQEITRIPHDGLISTQAFTDAFSLTPSTGSPVFFSLPESQRFPGILGSLLVGLATDFAAIVKNRTPPVKFA